MTDEEREKICEAISILENCGDDSGAAERLRDVVEPVVRSTWPQRLTNYSERIFFDHWKKENNRNPGINSGFRTLEHIMARPGKSPVPLSQRDYDVATAVIQWLGTSCGRAFVEGCETEIRKQRDECSELTRFIYSPIRPPHRDLFDRLMDRVLKDMIPHPKNLDDKETWKVPYHALGHLRQEIRGVMHVVFSLYCVETGLISEEEAAKGAHVHLKLFQKFRELGRRTVESRWALLQSQRAREVMDKVEEAVK